VLKDLAKGLSDRGVYVEVVTTAANEPEDAQPREEFVDGIVVRYLPRWRRSGWYFSPELWRTVTKLAPRFDLLDLEGVWTWPAAVGCAVARKAGKPHVVTPHGSFEPWALAHKGMKKRIYFPLIERRNFALAAAVRCLTNREAEQTRALVPGARCEVVPNAVAIDPLALTDAGRQAFAKRFPGLAGQRVVLFLSRILQTKGLDLLIPAFARVAARFPDAHLVIAGPDEVGYQAKVERLIAVRGLEKAVTFTGLLDGQDKLAAFDRAEAFVLPSRGEGLPVVVLEALAFGLPVVITDPCNLTDEVLESGAGFVVDTTVGAVAEGLERVLGDPLGARAMGDAAATLARERFSLDVVTARLVDLFDSILQRRREL